MKRVYRIGIGEAARKLGIHRQSLYRYLLPPTHANYREMPQKLRARYNALRKSCGGAKVTLGAARSSQKRTGRRR